jgi:DNA-binding CsgD family transcriptional regulator
MIHEPQSIQPNQERRTVSLKRQQIRAALEADSSRSDRRIAGILGVTREMVAAHRARLEEEGAIAQGPRFGRDKKLYRRMPEKDPTRVMRQAANRAQALLAEVCSPAFAGHYRQGRLEDQLRFRAAIRELAVHQLRLKAGGKS